MAQSDVSKEMLLDGARMALSAFLAGTMGFLKERKIPIKEWVAYIGDSFEGSLGELEGEGVEKVMEHLLALQVLPLGAEVLSSQATSDKAMVVLTPLPSSSILEKFGTTPRELMKGFGVTQKDFASIYAIYEPAAKTIGLRFRHQLKGGQELLSMERPHGVGTPRARRRAKKE